MSDEPEWWRTFFSGAPVQMWLQATPAAMTQGEAAFLEKELQAPAGSEILDVPCGGGRHAIELARRGYPMVGVDFSPEFLRAARERSGQFAIAWEERDMRDLPWPGRFAGAYFFGNSFGYLSEAADQEFLTAVARALKPKARFILDTSNVAEVVLPSFQERTWQPFGDLLFLADRRYHPETGQVESRYTFVRDGMTEQRTAWQRMYPYREVLRMLQHAGFEVQATYGDLERTLFRLGSRRLIVVAGVS